MLGDWNSDSINATGTAIAAIITALGAAILAILNRSTQMQQAKDQKQATADVKAEQAQAKAELKAVDDAQEQSIATLKADNEACHKAHAETQARFRALADVCPITGAVCPLQKVFWPQGRP